MTMLATCVWGLSLVATPQVEGERLNVVLLVTDDQGYGDLGCHGNPVLETPHLDRMASDSARLKRFYVSPVCSPTRASLMTGRWTYRTGVVDTFVGRSMMDPIEVTLAEVLRENGYATGIFGKWHLGDHAPMRPMDQGFETSVVHYGGGLAQPSEPPENQRRYTDPILLRDGTEVPTEGFCTSVYFDEALAFVDQCQAEDRPFFVYLPTNAPHGPFHDVPEALYEKYKKRDLTPVIQNAKRHDATARIFAMIEHFDTQVGRLFSHLDAKGLTENTLVLYVMDNGPNGMRFNAGLRGMKSDVYDGGIRSAFFAHLPGTLEPGEDERIAAHVDVFPTVLDLVGVSPPEGVALDGVSVRPLLDRAPADAWPARNLFIQAHRGETPRAGFHCAVIGPRYKLVRSSGFRGPGEQLVPTTPWELFDLQLDPGERTDVADELPDEVRALSEAYAAWFADVSSTRPNLFIPPRIEIDGARQPFVRFSKQDWRVGSASGWGTDGVWLVLARQEVHGTVRLRFQKPVSGEVVLTAGDRTVRADVETPTDSVSLGRVDWPSGPFDLRARAILPDGTSVGVYQVEWTHAEL